MITYTYRSSIRNLVFGVIMLIPCYFFIISVKNAEPFIFKIILFFLILVFSTISFLFFRFYFKNVKSKEIILREDKLILPLKSSSKTRKIPYGRIEDVYVSKVAGDMFSTLERNILIVTKSTTYCVEKSWMKNKKEFYSLLDNLQEKTGVEKNSTTQEIKP